MNHKKEQKPLTEAQILRKIQHSGVDSAEQYELIITNLEQQGERLYNQREQLKIKVDILLEKQKQLIEEQKSNKGKRNPTIDYTKLKRQLQQRYKEFEHWQKKIHNSINKGALNIQVKDYLNQCNLVSAQIIKYREMLHDQKYEHKKLQKSVKIQLKHLNKNIPQREVLEEENKELRKMIWNLRVVEDLTGHVEVRLHNSIVGLQNRKKFIDKLKTMTIQQIRRQQAKNKMDIINDELKQKKMRHDSLRRLKTQSRISTQKLSFQSQRFRQQQKGKEEDLTKIIEQKQKLVGSKEQESKKIKEELQNLEETKKKLQQQEAKLSNKLKEQQAKIEAKKSVVEPEMVHVHMQFDQFQDTNPLPKQIIGNETHLLQDDRMVLKTAKDTVITGLIAYENRIGIACLRVQYSNSKQSLCVPPQPYLQQKCKHKKVILHDPKDYLKWFKVYYDTYQKKLVRLQIYSNNKIKFEVGKQKQLLMRNVIPYKFDNGSHEVPVCMRVTYDKIEGDWVVSSLGLQINFK